VYSYNRTDVTPEIVQTILDEFEKAGMLQRWEERVATTVTGLGLKNQVGCLLLSASKIYKFTAFASRG